MLAILISWTAILFISISIGSGSIQFYNKILNKKEEYNLFETFIIGLVSVGVLLNITSIFVPTNIVITAILGVAAVIFATTSTQSRKNAIKRIQLLSMKEVVFILSSLFIFALLIIVPPQLDDTYFYHIQNTMWNEEYSAVYGLANIIEQMGFNSSFFLLTSVFGFRAIFGEYMYAINALCFILFFIQIILNMEKKRTSIAFISLVIFALLFIEYIPHIGSFSTDVLPNVIIAYLFIVLIEKKSALTNKSVLFLIVPLYCITLKLSTIFACTASLILLIMYIKDKQYKSVITAITLGIVVVLPWIVRNIIVSGYMIYPFPAIDLFEVDWKMPLYLVQASKDYVRANPIGATIQFENGYILNLSLLEQIKSWLHSNSIFNKIMMFTMLISPVLTILSLWLAKGRKTLSKHIVIVGAVAFLASVFCVFTGPAPRFFLGFIIAAIITPLFIYMEGNKLNISRSCIQISIVLVLLFSGILSARFCVVSSKGQNYSLAQYLLKPAGLEYTFEKQRQGVELVDVNNFKIFRPYDLYNPYRIGTPCFDCELPCTATIYDIEMRGESLQEGFRPVRK